MKDKKYNVAVVGATGVVGEVIISLLHEREFPVGEVHALASEQSAGKKVMCGSKPIVVKDMTNFDFSGVDYAFFSAGNSVSKEYVEHSYDFAKSFLEKLYMYFYLHFLLTCQVHGYFFQID